MNCSKKLYDNKSYIYNTPKMYHIKNSNLCKKNNIHNCTIFYIFLGEHAPKPLSKACNSKISLFKYRNKLCMKNYIKI